MTTAVLLALIAGCADGLSYLHFHTFAGALTGNTVLFGLSLFGGRPWDIALFGLVILSFCAGLVLSRTALRLGLPHRLPLLGTVAMFVMCDLVASRWAAMGLAFGMGLQNAAATRFAGTSINTVFLTGDLQQLVDRIVARIVPGRSGAASGQSVRPIALIALVWTAYVAGAVGGAAAEAGFSHPFLLPAAALFVIILCPPLWRRS